MIMPDDILAFWLDEVGPKGWYDMDAGRDAIIRDRFEGALHGLMEGRYGLWLTYPSGALDISFWPTSFRATSTVRTGAPLPLTMWRAQRPNRPFTVVGIYGSTPPHGSSSTCP